MKPRSRSSGDSALGLAGIGLFAASIRVSHFFSEDADLRIGLVMAFPGFGAIELLPCVTFFPLL